jgi:hypothetical protein
MTTEGAAHTFAFTRRIAPEFCKIVPPNEIRAQGTPGARCTHGPCAEKMHTVATTGSPEITRRPLRNGFNGFLRALLGDEF